MLAKHEFLLWILAIVGTAKNGHLHILLLMQQILAFRVSFVDLGRPFDKFRPALFRWNSPCEIKKRNRFELNIYG
jgi:hypothetical protein